MSPPGADEPGADKPGPEKAGTGKSGAEKAGPEKAVTGKPKPPAPPLWRQAFDAAERAVTPRAEELVRSPGFNVGAALVRRAQTAAKESAQGLAARAWHLINLPAGSDVSRLRAQIGSLDREVRRLSLQLEAEQRRSGGRKTRPTSTEESHGDRAQPADDPGPGPARRGTERPPGA